MLKNRAIKVMKQENPTLCHDRATPHISKKTSTFLANGVIKTLLLFMPGRSPDAMPIENVFPIIKKRLEALLTRTIEEVKSEVAKVWRLGDLTDGYLEELCTSMRRRCTGIINHDCYPTKY